MKFKVRCQIRRFSNIILENSKNFADNTVFPVIVSFLVLGMGKKTNRNYWSRTCETKFNPQFLAFSDFLQRVYIVQAGLYIYLESSGCGINGHIYIFL